MKKKIVGTTVVFTFEDGVPELVFDSAAASEKVRTRAMLHGFSARLGDNAAITKSTDNGYKVTEAMRRAAVAELADHYTTGTEAWDVGAGTRKAPQNAAILSVAAKLGVNYEEAEAYVANMAIADLIGE